MTNGPEIEKVENRLRWLYQSKVDRWKRQSEAYEREGPEYLYQEALAKYKDYKAKLEGLDGNVGPGSAAPKRNPPLGGNGSVALPLPSKPDEEIP
jgi:hypothetical protein